VAWNTPGSTIGSTSIDWHCRIQLCYDQAASWNPHSNAAAYDRRGSVIGSGSDAFGASFRIGVCLQRPRNDDLNGYCSAYAKTTSHSSQISTGRPGIDPAGALASGCDRSDSSVEPIVRTVEGAADRTNRVLDGDHGGQCHFARHRAEHAPGGSDAVFEPREFFAGIATAERHQTTERCFKGMGQDKCSHALLKKRSLALFHFGEFRRFANTLSHQAGGDAVSFSPHGRIRV
jgi:hypothetical protein